MAFRKQTESSTPTQAVTTDRAVPDQTTQHMVPVAGSHEATSSTGPTAHAGHDEAQERFGGINWGSAFFGWLVAIGLTILLTGIVGAIATAVSDSSDVTQSEAERQAGTIGIVAAVVLLVVLALAYYAGGYVAGRMSRFDGGKQGLAVWIIGLVVTLLAIGLGAAFGNEYNIFDRVDLPRLPISTDDLSLGGLITAVAVVVLTLLAAMAGGKVGQRYHNKVDRVAHR
jgi:membrane protease YdiL (CAAX protease family)